MKKIKRYFILIFAVLLITALIWMIRNGKEGKIAIPVRGDETDFQCSLTPNESQPATGQMKVTITSVETVRGGSVIHCRTEGSGTVWMNLSYSSASAGGVEYLQIRADRFGLIWIDTVPQGSELLAAVCLLGMLLMLIYFVMKFRAVEKACPYTYQLAAIGSMILFLFIGLVVSSVIAIQSLRFGTLLTFDSVVIRLSEMPMIFNQIIGPMLFIGFSAMAVSNLFLIAREGRNWRNFVGSILILINLAAIYGMDFFVRMEMFDLFKNSSVSAYVTVFTGQFFISGLLCYMECLILTIMVYALKAARHEPALDRDFIIILGCGIDKDGSLFPLLRGRVDRAVAFAARQFKQTGKQAMLMPSGGQGEDECLSEGEAMRRYLFSIGVEENAVIPETRSLNTLENMLFSKAIIDAHQTNAKTAFSTTNYHVLRAGIYAAEAGLKAEGMGSKTAWYFWPNAFARELVAMLVREKKQHFLTTGILLICSFLLGSAAYVMMM